MTAVFIKLLNMSITASWLILAVTLLRIILKNAPKWIRCIMWGLVAVRLICPLSIESIFSLLPSTETIPQDIMDVDKATIHTGGMAINSVMNPYISESIAPGVGDSVNPMQVVMNVGTVIWFAGMIGMLIYAVVSFLRIKRKADASLPMRENIYLCDYINTPFVLGIVRPRIYLPSALAEDDKTEFVIAHEKAHIRRGDHWWKPLGFLLLTVYWFNPAIWIAYILLCRDIELACDEYVIGSLREKEKKTYSDALLACSIKSSGFHRNMISACPLAFGEVGVKDRVKAVLHYKRPAFWLVILGLLACIVAAICFLTDPIDNTSQITKDKWDCTIHCAEESAENSYVITYSDQEIVTDIGCLTFQNRNNFSITVHLIGEGKEAFVRELAPGGIVVFMQADQEVTYTVGIHADVEEGTEVSLMVYDGEWSEVYTLEQDTPMVDREYVLNQVIKETILNQYKPEKPDGLYHCADFIILEQEEICGVAPVNSGKDNMELVTVYGMALHESLGFSGATFHEVSYDYVPVKLQFQKESESEYVLKDAWFPEKPYESWDIYQEDIWGAFSTYSEELATDAIYAIQDDIYLTSLRQKCYEQAVSFGTVGTDTVIEGLLEEVVASPGTFASGVKDYIVANEAAYKELIHYGKYTLWYCFGEFLEGDQTDLRGQIMASVCKDIMLGFGEAMLTDTEAAHGQEWFDMFLAIARSTEKRYREEDLKTYYPGSWLLIKLADSKGIEGKELVPIEELDWEKILKDHLRNE